MCKNNIQPITTKKDYSVRELIILGEKNNKIDLASSGKKTQTSNNNQQQDQNKT